MLRYVVTCTCFSIVIITHHTLYNTQLVSMSVPAEEEFAEIGQIQVTMHTSMYLYMLWDSCG